MKKSTLETAKILHVSWDIRRVQGIVGYYSFFVWTWWVCAREGSGDTPLTDLNGDVRPERVWFSEGFVLYGVRVYVITAKKLNHLIKLYIDF